VFSSRIAVLGAALVVPTLGGNKPVRAPLPFEPGERITYHVHVNGTGMTGRATMSVDGPIDVRGVSTYLLKSQTSAGFGPLKGTQLSESWLDPLTMTSLRFHERERRLFSTRTLTVEIYPDEGRWATTDGASGQSPTSSSLDELSFIYFLRSLPFSHDTTYAFSRHYDAARNPTTVRMTRVDSVTTEIGRFPAVLMEMHVRDPRRYSGDGTIRVYISDDACRIPLRIDSSVPGVGSLVLTLESYSAPGPRCTDGR
jgi:hypothetical protein